MVPVMVECPLCQGLGCVICHETGQVKKSNLERARERDGWSFAAYMRLYRLMRGRG